MEISQVHRPISEQPSYIQDKSGFCFLIVAIFGQVFCLMMKMEIIMMEMMTTTMMMMIRATR